MDSAFGTDLSAWHDFYLGTMTAAAAPAGLVFVALSLRPLVLADERLGTQRGAASVFARFVVVTAVSGLLLVPGQPPEWLGAELTVAGRGRALAEQCGAHLLGSFPLKTRDHVRVQIQRHRDRRMPKRLLDDLRMDAES